LAKFSFRRLPDDYHFSYITKLEREKESKKKKKKKPTDDNEQFMTLKENTNL